MVSKKNKTESDVSSSKFETARGHGGLPQLRGRSVSGLPYWDLLQPPCTKMIENDSSDVLEALYVLEVALAVVVLRYLRRCGSF